MKTGYISTIILALSLCACHNSADDHVGCDHSHGHTHEAHENHKGHKDHDHDHDHDHEGHEGHNHAKPAPAHEHTDEIALHDEVAERFGVKFDTIRPAEFHEVVRVSGRADASVSSAGIVSAPITGIVHFAKGINSCSHVRPGTVIATIDPASTLGGDANAAAKAVLDAAKRELDRIKPLYEDRLVTATEYNAAIAAYEQAKAAYSPRANGGRAIASLAGCISSLNVAEGQYVEAGEPIATITSDKELTLRVELPRRFLPVASSFTEAVIEQPYSSPIRIALKSMHSPVAPSGAASAFVPLFFTIPHEHGLTPGATFTAYLAGGKREGVVTLSLSGISEQQGAYFVYERVHPEAYAKRRVELGASDGERVEIKSGLRNGAVVVSEGATAVRLAETGSAVPEGHTHNH